MYVEIPYTGTTTNSFKKNLSRISAKLRPDLDVHFFARPPPSVQSFFNMKDPIPKHLQANSVYSVQCTDCGQIYVGKTERQPIRRLREHGAPYSTFEEANLLCLSQTDGIDHEHNEADQNDHVQTIQKQIGPIRNRKRIKPAP
jgi:hypothetical protein